MISQLFMDIFLYIAVGFSSLPGLSTEATKNGGFWVFKDGQVTARNVRSLSATAGLVF